MQNCLTSERRSKLACIMPNARDNGENCHTSEHQRCVPRRNPRWSERSEWNLGYESQRIIAHRRCRLTPTREKKHRGRWDASSKLPIHYASPPHVCCAAREVPTRAASLMLTCINCYRLFEQFARLVHVRKRLDSSDPMTYFYQTAIFSL